MIRGVYLTEANSRRMSKPDANTLDDTPTKNGPGQLRFSKQRSKAEVKGQGTDPPLIWERQRILHSTPRPIKILNFEVLSKEWRDRPKRITENLSEFCTSARPTKHLPDSKSTVDPS